MDEGGRGVERGSALLDNTWCSLKPPDLGCSEEEQEGREASPGKVTAVLAPVELDWTLLLERKALIDAITKLCGRCSSPRKRERADHQNELPFPFVSWYHSGHVWTSSSSTSPSRMPVAVR